MYDVILWCTNYENVKIILRNIVVIEMFKKKSSYNRSLNDRMIDDND